MSYENYETLQDHEERIRSLETRIHRLEDILVELINVEEEIDTTDLGMARAEAREGYDDR